MSTKARNPQTFSPPQHVSTIYVAMLCFAVACVDEEDPPPPVLGACEFETTGAPPPIEGDWDEEIEDWHDPGPDGNDVLLAPDACGHNAQITAHHCFTTAVHAVHTHTGHILTMHGDSDQRLWEIGAPEDEITWHPVPFQSTYQRRVVQPDPENPDQNVCDGQPWCWEDDSGWPDIFCSGQVQLSDGRIYFAGGNVTGGGAGGGLFDTFVFDPSNASAAPTGACPFGWGIDAGASGVFDQNQAPPLQHDRWYPTLTVLRDGRVLISSGYSRQAANADGLAQRTRLLEVYDPTSGTMEQLSDALFPLTVFPAYPLMFLLPNGDVFYAGSEEASEADAATGRILIPDYNNSGTWTWSDHVVASTVAGGSAVMFAPGKILKTGGRVFGDNFHRPASNISEVVDLSTYASGDYGAAPTAFSIAAPMANPRHYHNLTVLPDGRVLAVGGNVYGNSQGVDHFNNPCRDPANENEEIKISLRADDCYSECIEWNPDQVFCDDAVPPPSDRRCSLLNAIPCDTDQDCENAMAGAFCTNGECRKTCTSNNDCSRINGDVAPANPDNPEFCWPHSNECEAVYTAEIWDPACNRWESLGDQDYPRMYHSTALLIPDGRVVSMGGGHRDLEIWRNLREGVVTEYFEPEYGSGARPVFTLDGSSDPNADEPYLPWDGSVEITIENDVTPASATLVRLGATTHGFDQDQRWIPLGALSGSGSSFTVPGPASGGGDLLASNIAPPGYYMLFIFSEDGQPSVGQYIRVGGMLPAMFVCEATSTLQAAEQSCSGEPIAGQCPPALVHTESAPLPSAYGKTGFVVLSPAGSVENPLHPTAEELVELQGRCSQACDAYFADRPGQDANCDASGAFTPSLIAQGVDPSLDLLRSDTRSGEGLFAGQQVGCDLGTSCYAEFDEALASAVPRRVSPAGEMLEVGEEFRVSLGDRSSVSVTTNRGTYDSRLTGSTGYSFCADGSGSTCPFYLGSLEALAASTIYAEAVCDDGSEARLALDDFALRLSQPAFGVADATSDAKAFAAGTVLLDTSFTLDREHFATRRPNRLPVVLNVSAESFSATGLAVQAKVPCGASTALVTVQLDLESPDDGSALARPPEVDATTPSTVTCGTPVALTASTSDRDNDLEDVRWFVDDVLLSRSMASVPITQNHTLRAVAYDERGAATTATKAIQCN